MINWIEDRFKKSIECNYLFQESIKCYKIEAYRASLLFSYLGFLTYIKEVIISSRKPTDIDESRWNDLLRKINNDDYWEQRVFDELNNNSSCIFKFNDSIRQQIRYWKDRRNDCAHFKDNEINQSHVEMFWVFIKSNLNKISVEGSKENLIQKFKIFFDRTKTPPNKTPDDLIYSIEDSVDYTDLQDFFKSIDEIEIIGEQYITEEEKNKIYYQILSVIQNERIKNELVSFIRGLGRNKDLNFILDFPGSIFYLNYNPEDIREIWKKRLWGLDYRKYNLMVNLLKNGKIPALEQKEFFEEFYKRFNQIGFNNLYLGSDSKQILFNNSLLLEIIYNDFFVNGEIYKSDYEYINSKEELLSQLFLNTEIDHIMIEGLKKMRENDINPFWLKNALTDIFSENLEIAEKVVEIGKEIGCDKKFYQYFRLED